MKQTGAAVVVVVVAVAVDVVVDVSASCIPPVPPMNNMLRSFDRSLARHSRLWVPKLQQPRAAARAATSSARLVLRTPRLQRGLLVTSSRHVRLPTPASWPTGSLRALSSGQSGETKSSQKKSSSKNKEGGEDDANELVLTPGEQVVLASRLTMWAGIAAFASVCAYFIIRELMPTYVTHEEDRDDTPCCTCTYCSTLSHLSPSFYARP
jgi:hypothetical protein